MGWFLLAWLGLALAIAWFIDRIKEVHEEDELGYEPGYDPGAYNQNKNSALTGFSMNNNWENEKKIEDMVQEMKNKEEAKIRFARRSNK